jgi:hypothetical protein
MKRNRRAQRKRKLWSRKRRRRKVRVPEDFLAVKFFYNKMQRPTRRCRNSSRIKRDTRVPRQRRRRKLPGLRQKSERVRKYLIAKVFFFFFCRR